MVKYCKSCGSELDDEALFCNDCGSKVGESLPSKNISQDSSDNPFSRYKIDMISGENVIKISEIHVGCLYAPLILVVIAFLIMILSAFILFPIFLIALVWFIIRYIGYTNNDLILTNKRVFGKCGLISTTQMQSPLNKIDSVSFKNGLFGKLIGYGTVEVATTSSHFNFRFIKEGQTFYNDIFNQLEISENEKRIENAEAIADAISKK